MKLEFHHIGLLTDSIENSIINYQALFPESIVSEKYFISSQAVWVCFFLISDSVRLEFVQAHNESSVVWNMYRKGIKYYHAGYLTEDIDQSITEADASNYKLLSKFNSEAFNNKPCAFLLSPEGHLIEFIQK